MINQKYIVKLNGKPYVTYEGLLDAAHKIGLKSITVDVVQFPSKDKDLVAICKATAKNGSGGLR